jgi:hypothetical protein
LSGFFGPDAKKLTSRMGLARRYVELINGRRWIGVVILLLWVGLAVAGACLVGPFLRATVNDLGVPSDAPSAKARAQGAELGLDFAKNLFRLTVFVENRTGVELEQGAVDAALQRLRATVDRTYPGVTAWDGVPFALQRGEVAAATSFVSPSKRSQIAFAQVDSKKKGVEFMDQFARFLVSQAEFVEQMSDVRLSVLGDARNKEVIINAVIEDLAFGDGIALPVAFAVLAGNVIRFHLLVC